MRLLGELSRRGTARAVDLAGAVGEPANSVSFHLRQLAKFGLIEENPGRAQNGRERWWRPTSDQGFEIDLGAMQQREGGDAAVDTLRRVGEGHVLALHRATRQPSIASTASAGVERDHPVAQRTISDDFALRLSSSEFAQLRTELRQLFDRWGEISRRHSDSDEGERNVEERHAYYGAVMAALEADIVDIYNAQKDDQ